MQKTQATKATLKQWAKKRPASIDFPPDLHAIFPTKFKESWNYLLKDALFTKYYKAEFLKDSHP